MISINEPKPKLRMFVHWYLTSTIPFVCYRRTLREREREREREKEKKRHIDGQIEGERQKGMDR